MLNDEIVDSEIDDGSTLHSEQNIYYILARIFLLVDLRDFFQIQGRGTKK